MEYFSMAVTAKRNREFDKALHYYDFDLRQNGIDVGVLMAVAKVYYLKNEYTIALKHNLAATHLAMHLNEKSLKRGDIVLKASLEQVPLELKQQLPHEVAGTLYLNVNYARHTAHAILDSAKVLQRLPQLKPYAEIYYASILGDGTEADVHRKYNVNENEVDKIEQIEYMPLGMNVLFNEIKWDQLSDIDVYKMYF